MCCEQEDDECDYTDQDRIEAEEVVEDMNDEAEEYCNINLSCSYAEYYTFFSMQLCPTKLHDYYYVLDFVYVMIYNYCSHLLAALKSNNVGK